MKRLRTISILSKHENYDATETLLLRPVRIRTGKARQRGSQKFNHYGKYFIKTGDIGGFSSCF